MVACRAEDVSVVLVLWIGARQACAKTPYELNMYDLRLLGPGGSRSDEIPEYGARFYQVRTSP